MELVFSPLRTVDLVAVALPHPRRSLPWSVRVVGADVAFTLGQLADDITITGSAAEHGHGGRPARRSPGLDELVALAEQRLRDAGGDDQR